MAEETNTNTTNLYSLQTRIDRLEVVIRDLEHKLLIQNECIERLLRDFNPPKANTMVSLANEENQQLLPVKDQSADKLTADASIHNLPLLNILG